ncbi:MAG: flagellar hook-associated protein FlgK [Acidobacteriales bacterium]|nr:flagellar hook-associated protein FlgK [Terriglobales bacterium]
MGNLMASLLASANAMRTFERSMGVVENNVANSSTPGYAKQRLTLLAEPFQIETGLPGGVTLGEAQSMRSEYAERTVRQYVGSQGRYSQQATDLGRVEMLFDSTGKSGIPGALSDFFQSISGWSVAPTDQVARQSVIDQAGVVALNFNQAAAGLMQASADMNSQATSVVGNINRLVAQILDYNEEVRANASSASDAGLEATVNSALEELAEYTDFTALKADDNSYTLFVGGQTLTLIGDRQYPIEAVVSGQEIRILDAQSHDVTDQIQGGRLASIVEVKNSEIPQYLQQLNRLAAATADQVNSILATGLAAADQHPLFAYGAADSAAATLSVTGITPDQLASAPPTSAGGNTNILSLAELGQKTVIDGFTLTGFYGSLAGQVGRDLSQAKTNQSTQEGLLAQARSMREEISGVSLDEEAARLMEYQRAYQAAARLVRTLDELTDTLMTLIQ